ncbi:MAG: amino acid carrier protein [Candidatus Binatia bacterium]|nr:amino acid carrier protein [Candidatus Binatia bacterium]MDG2010271.1 amino acid carrier protein [Candidatus Binatia bacterium]
MGFQDRLDSVFGIFNQIVSPVLFADFILGIPLILLVLIAGGVFFTVRYGFIHVRLFKHSIDCIRGRYDDPDDPGEISHFSALTSALSATVGLGNIAGVAVAIAAGGPGAILWMWVVAFFGMSLKFSSSTLAQIYRNVDDRGHVLGGPMVYLRVGIRENFPKLGWVGTFLGALYAVLCILASFGGGNLFQGKMSFAIAGEVIPSLSNSPMAPWFAGAFYAVLVGAVIIGGIRRIGDVTSRLVPAMCLSYAGVCVLIILLNLSAVPGLLGDIVTQAFTPAAAYGGFLGVFIQGVRRAAFSNEAGMGSASIAHAAARTDEPVREGVVAMIGPFIDTIFICTLTALTILLTGVAEPGQAMNWTEGAVLTARAFGTLSQAAEYLLVLAVFVFAYSTMIAWSYYGERASEFLFGKAGILPYRVVYVFFAAIGPVVSVANVLDFSDLMLLALAFPNLVGMLLLAGVVNRQKDAYLERLRGGIIRPTES